MNRKGFLYNAAPWLHLLFLVGLTLFCMVLFSAFSMALVPLLFGIPFMEMLESMGDLSAGGNPSVLKFLQACQSRSEEHTSELQSLMSISYAVFCLKKKNQYI